MSKDIKIPQVNKVYDYNFSKIMVKLRVIEIGIHWISSIKFEQVVICHMVKKTTAGFRRIPNSTTQAIPIVIFNKTLKLIK